MELIRRVSSKRQYKDSIPSKVKLIIHHQFPNIELVSPVYVGNGARCLSPDQTIDVGSAVQVDFKCSSGALSYKLQRKNESNDATCTQLLIAWEVRDSGEFFVVPNIIAHDKSHIWDETRLEKLTGDCRVLGMRHGSIEDTWLMYDNTVLMIRVNVICEAKCYKLEVIISEGSIKDDTQRPRYIDLNM
jgi:hypothetical protein